MKRRPLALFALALPLLAAGCAGKSEEERAKTAIKPRECPRVAYVGPARERTVFAGEGRAPADTVAVMRLADARGECEYAKDGAASVEYELIVSAARGPAMQGDSVGFGYFVAVLAPDGQTVKSRREYRSEIAFEDGATQAFATLEVDRTIRAGSDLEAEQHRLAVGFLLTDEELAWNQAH